MADDEHMVFIADMVITATGTLWPVVPLEIRLCRNTCKYDVFKKSVFGRVHRPNCIKILLFDVDSQATQQPPLGVAAAPACSRLTELHAGNCDSEALKVLRTKKKRRRFISAFESRVEPCLSTLSHSVTATIRYPSCACVKGGGEEEEHQQPPPPPPPPLRGMKC